MPLHISVGQMPTREYIHHIDFDAIFFFTHHHLFHSFCGQECGCSIAGFPGPSQDGSQGVNQAAVTFRPTPGAPGRVWCLIGFGTSGPGALTQASPIPAQWASPQGS